MYNQAPPPRRSSDPVPGTQGPIRPPSVPGGSAMPVGAAPAAAASAPPQSPKLLQRALDERMRQTKYASGGSVKGASRGDGCARKGHTKGRVV